jgi:rSAM/selenodomain-associated transferase 1
MERTPDITGNDCAIGIMAKAPRAGFSKTRLCPPLDSVQAAGLSAAFLRDISENIAQAGRQTPITGYVAYAPAGQEALFDGHLAPGTGLLLADGSPRMPPDVRGFGRCLLHAIQAMLARGHASAVVLNSDSPTLPNSLLVRTATALAAGGDRVVLGPAEDGGYYLLGMKTAHANLFADIAWSTESVAETTRLRASQLGLEVVELPAWYDVDDWAALNRLLEDIANHPSPSVSWPVRSSLSPAGSPSLSPLDSPAVSSAGFSPGSWPDLARPPGTSVGPEPRDAGARTKPAHDRRLETGTNPPKTTAMPSRSYVIAGSRMQPYPAPFTARALARIGLRAPNLDLPNLDLAAE